jgi:hypothetical protein
MRSKVARTSVATAGTYLNVGSRMDFIAVVGVQRERRSTQTQYTLPSCARKHAFSSQNPVQLPNASIPAQAAEHPANNKMKLKQRRFMIGSLVWS